MTVFLNFAFTTLLQWNTVCNYSQVGFAPKKAQLQQIGVESNDPLYEGALLL
jgi:hypothetical protein